MKIISSTQLKELDKYTIAKEPVASIDLMERAAEELTRAITHRWDTSFHIVVFAGPGNNGGDALADASYGQVWIPFTSTDLPNDTWSDQHMGMMSVTILARSHDDFGEIRAEAKRRMSEYNSILADQGYTLIDRNRPYDQETQSISFAANLEPDLKSARRERAIIFIILLLVPAINLSSMTQSRLRQRVAEIGVRRAFGSTRMEMVGQIIMENLVVTLLAGAVGLFISIVMAYLGTDILFAQPYSATLNAPTVDSSILLHPSTFLYALLFCFVLNLLSSGIPAWRASRTSIVNALGGRIH